MTTASGAASSNTKPFSPIRSASCSGVNHLSGAVYSLIQLNGDAKKTLPPSFTKEGNRSMNASGSCNRHTKLAASTASNVPRDSGRLQASPFMNVSFSASDGEKASTLHDVPGSDASPDRA